MKDSTRDSDRGWSFVDVQSIRLDDVLDADSLQRPIILKVDTQGAEPLVFRGGTKIFSQADLVIMEFWPLGMQQLGQNPLDLLQEVKSLYQDFCALDPVSGDTISRSYEEIMDLIKARIADSSSEHFDLVLSAPSYASQASPS
jgi:hypothetical protein